MGERGRVESIHIAPAGSAPLMAVGQARAVAGKGLEGDRYFLAQGTYSKTPGTGRQVTLIEAEALEALERDSGIRLAPGESRRNIVTRGVALNHLVGQEFRIGEVILRGTRLCEPCGHLEGLTRAGVKDGLHHRAGLRAEIVREGILRVGDAIALVAATEAENKALVRRDYEEMWNRWNFAATEELLAPDILFRGSLGVATRGRAAFQDYMQLVRLAFPDFHNAVEELIAEGDRVVARLTYRGTHQGEIFGVAPTRKQVTYTGVAIFSIADGKIIEGWVLGDRLAVLEQIGARKISPLTTEKGKR